MLNAYATGAVTVTGGSYNGSYDVGGFIGFSDGGTVSNTYATGAVTGGSGSQYVGGLIGRAYEGTVQNSYWDVQTSR